MTGWRGTLYAGGYRVPGTTGPYRLTLEARLELDDRDRERIDHSRGPVLRLSISGSVSHYNRDQSGGQCLDDLRRIIAAGEPAAPVPVLRRVLDVWERWHLNDMRAGCIHQTPEWTCHGDRYERARKDARLLLDADARELRRKWDDTTEAGRLALEAAERLTAAAQAAADAVPSEPCETANGWPVIRSVFGEHPYPQRGDQCYVCGRNRWDETADHCPVTGYAWGRGWLNEPVPADVVDFIARTFGIIDPPAVPA